MNDPELMKLALSDFQIRAKEKFEAGIREHNPNGNKGIMRMKILDKIKCAKEEIMDLWFYVSALEQHITDQLDD